MDQLLPESDSQSEPKGSFQDFYKIVVDGIIAFCSEDCFATKSLHLEMLFSTTSSATRKYWGFQVFQKALEKAGQETVPMLFTKNFMRTWINHLSKRDRYLHKIALQTVRAVILRIIVLITQPFFRQRKLSPSSRTNRSLDLVSLCS